MKLTRGKKIILMIVLTAFVVLLFNSDTAFAAVNTGYSGTDSVPDTALEEAFEKSTLLELLAKLIYAVGRFLEWILGTIFRLLTGSSDFPWADKIVFNAVPLLDVNFMNPGANSFVAQPGIKEVLQNLYATIMTLSIGFFGIVVLITSIRLVISTIASEKAKYKQAIVDWLVGFVMLFCIHYFISFVFYLNEQLVIVASEIVKEQLDGTNAIAQTKANKIGQELINDVRSRGITYNGKLVADILEENQNVLSTWMNGLSSKDTSKGLQEGLMKKSRWYWLGADTAKNENDQYKLLGMIVSWASEANLSVSELTELKGKIKVFRQMVPNKYTKKLQCNGNNQAISTTDLKMLFVNNGTFNQQMYNDFVQGLDGIEETFKGIVNNENTLEVWADIKGGSPVKGTETYIGDGYYLLSRGSSEFGVGNQYNNDLYVDDTNFHWTKVFDDLIKLKSASNTSGGKKISGSGKGQRLISDLANYFRYNSYSKERRSTNVTGVKNGDNIQIQNMIMYAVLVAQSLILFIAYIKRLFYVILIAMMGPVVVVFDFFQKFGK